MDSVTRYGPMAGSGVMAGQTCLITGATSGIGRAAARELAGMGAQVVIVARNADRGEATRSEIVRETGNDSVGLLMADLAKQKDVRGLANAFRSRYDRLDVLVNNAGLRASRRILTEDGVESCFAVNHLAPFLLTNLLEDMLVGNAPARVVTVASTMHKAGRIDFADLQGERSWSAQRAYNQSKLANVLFTYELARRLEGTRVTANCLHPGVVRSNFGMDSPRLTRLVFGLARPFMISPEKGADTVVYLASAPELAEATGGYYAHRMPKRSSRASYDTGTAHRLWDLSAELTGLTAAAPPDAVASV